jgi:predicted nucleic acid-binding protein
MILVADCSALIALSTCKGLYLLDALFGTEIVPETVFHEATISDKPEADSLKIYLEGKVRQVDMGEYVYLDSFADTGETEAMLLFKQVGADKLLIDDKRGRKVAMINNISTIGSLGILLAAKQVGLITDLAPLLDQISSGLIYLSPELIKTVLNIVGEEA